MEISIYELEQSQKQHNMKPSVVIRIERAEGFGSILHKLLYSMLYFYSLYSINND
jgi:hypothetical protein